MAITVEIIEGHHLPISKTIKEKTYYSQKAYIDLGGPFPVEFDLPIEAPVNANPIGKGYVLCPSSFKVNQYGNLELDKYNTKIIRPLPHNAATKG